jgi:hypothetical protein
MISTTGVGGFYGLVFLEEPGKFPGGLGQSFFFPTGVSGFIDQIEQISKLPTLNIFKLKVQIVIVSTIVFSCGRLCGRLVNYPESSMSRQTRLYGTINKCCDVNSNECQRVFFGKTYF